MSVFRGIQEAFGYLESFTNFEQLKPHLRDYRLDRMKALLDMFGNPERAFRSVHVAGSKGKGSTATFIASIFTAMGYRTGLYLSPHVCSYKERITLSGRDIDDAVFIRHISAIKERIDNLKPSDLPGEDLPTTFELLTLLGFMVFRDTACSWAVVETGLGGRLDATNLIVPEASVLTPIELEHTDLLGRTIPAIAGEKAGIIKPTIPVFSSAQKEEARVVFEDAARRVKAPIVFLPDVTEYRHAELSRTGTRLILKIRGGQRMEANLAMLGEVQADNAALAFLVTSSLFKNPTKTYPGLSPELFPSQAKSGLEHAFLPGRMELVKSSPPIILDAAHTPVSVQRLRESFEAICADEEAVLIFGAVSGKDIEGMAKVLAPSFRHIIVSKPGYFKPNDPEEVYSAFLRYNAGTTLQPDPALALREALTLSEGKHPILVTGSFYMVAEIRKHV